MLAVLTFFSCGRAGNHYAGSQLAAAPSSSPPPSKAIALTGAGTGGGGMNGPDSIGDRAWWEDPETGQEGWITEGYATIGLEYFPDWIFNPPADTDLYNELFTNSETVQALIQQGYELVYPYGILMFGEFRLPPGMTFSQARTSVSTNPLFSNIAFFDPWSFREPHSYPNDPWLYSLLGPEPGVYQWSLFNQEWGHPDYDVNAPEGWSIQRGSDDIVVAVLDTGVDRAVPDIGTRLTYFGWNVRGTFPPPNYQNIILPPPWGGAPAMNQNGIPQVSAEHGTEVSSVIGASTNNAYQMAGGTWAGKVLPISLQQIPPPFSNEMPDEWITHALYMLTDQAGLTHIPALDSYPNYNVKVINLSMGGTLPNTSHSLLLWLLGWKALVVCSAGNSGNSGNPIIYPAASDRLLFPWFKRYREDITLTATSFNKAGFRSSFASYYDPSIHDYNWVDVSAPGEGILVLSPTWRSIYEVVQGTSFSAPHASALGMLMFAEHPNLSAWQIHDAIETFTNSSPPLFSSDIPARIDYGLALSLGGQR
jgi:subtilisin family serine protease